MVSISIIKVCEETEFELAFGPISSQFCFVFPALPIATELTALLI